MRRLLVLLPLAAATALLAGCGSGDDGEAEGEITALIEVTAVTTNPAACTTYFTLNLVEQLTKVPGPQAIQVCEASTKDEPSAESVTVSDIEVDGNRGSVVAAYEGGSLDGQTVSYDVVSKGIGWRLDEITGYPVFDRGAWLRESAKATYRRAHTQAEMDEAACAVARLRRLDDEALVELILDPSPLPLMEIVRACEGHSASA